MSNIAYYMSIEKRLPNYLKSCDKHKKRENYCLKNSWNTTYSIKSYLENPDTMAELKSLNCTKLVQPAYDLLKSNMIPIASDAKWKDNPFGAASTLGKSGCMAFCTYNTLLLANLPYPPLLTFSEVTKLLVTHGYCLWKFAQDPQNEVLNLPRLANEPIILSNLKEIYHDSKEMQYCVNLEEVYSILGNPVDIGGSPYFMDELFALMPIQTWSKPEVNKEPKLKYKHYRDTRISNISTIFKNLKNEVPVPVRLQEKNNGHYVVLIGFEYGSAVYIDSSSPNPICRMPAEDFLNKVADGKPGFAGIAFDVSALV